MNNEPTASGEPSHKAEPVAWFGKNFYVELGEYKETKVFYEYDKNYCPFPLYTHPAKTQADIEYEADKAYWRTRTLTDEEIISLINKHIDYVPDGDGMKVVGVMDLCKAILRKAQEK
jgi:hypothetical protein